MNIEAALHEIVAAQKVSALSSTDFYAALARIARQDAILRTVLNRGTWTPGVANPLAQEPPMPTLLETKSAPLQGSEAPLSHAAICAAAAALGEASRNGHLPEVH